MMRRQIYEWRGVVPSAASPNPFTLNLHPILTINPFIPAYNTNPRQPLEIFVGGYGSNLDIPAFVTASQFIVIDEISVWPPEASINLWVEQTQYFQNPDNVVSRGVTGYTSPFSPSGGTQFAPLGWMPSFSLTDTPLYVKQGQTWGAYFYLCNLNQNQTVRDITTNTATSQNHNYAVGAAIPPTDGDIWIPRAYLEFVLFDGADSLIAFQLMSQDMPVSVKTVTAYKQMLIRHQLMSDIHEREEYEEDLKSVPKRFS